MDKLKVSGGSLIETTVAMTILILVITMLTALTIKVNQGSISKQIRANKLIDSLSYQMSLNGPRNTTFTVGDLTVNTNVKTARNPGCMILDFVVFNGISKIRSETRILKWNERP